MSIEPEKSEREEKLLEWEQKSYQYAYSVVEEYIMTRKNDIYRFKKEQNQIMIIPYVLTGYIKRLNCIYSKIDGFRGKEEQ